MKEYENDLKKMERRNKRKNGIKDEYSHVKFRREIYQLAETSGIRENASCVS